MPPGRLIERLRDADPNVRAAAADALGAVGGTAAASALRELATRGGEDRLVRFSALHALGVLEVPLVARDLMPVLDDPVLRPAGIDLLGRSDDEEAVAVLLKALATDSRTTREAAMRALLRVLSRVDGSARRASGGGGARGRRRRALRGGDRRRAPGGGAALDPARAGAVPGAAGGRARGGADPAGGPGRGADAGRPRDARAARRASPSARSTRTGMASTAARAATLARCSDVCAGSAARRVCWKPSTRATRSSAPPRCAGSERAASRTRCRCWCGGSRRWPREGDREGEEEMAALTEALTALASPGSSDAGVAEQTLQLLASRLEGADEDVRLAIARVLGRIGRREDTAARDPPAQGPESAGASRCGGRARASRSRDGGRAASARAGGRIPAPSGSRRPTRSVHRRAPA